MSENVPVAGLGLAVADGFVFLLLGLKSSKSESVSLIMISSSESAEASFFGLASAFSVTNKRILKGKFSSELFTPVWIPERL